MSNINWKVMIDDLVKNGNPPIRIFTEPYLNDLFVTAVSYAYGNRHKEIEINRLKVRLENTVVNVMKRSKLTAE